MKTDAALVLPETYGWSMRYSEDKVWGILKPHEETLQFWKPRLENHRSKLDIVYEDGEFSLASLYKSIYPLV